jgi:hypothetical protein
VSVDGSDAALKVQLPPCVWEFYACRALHGRCEARMRPAFMRADRIFLLGNRSALLSPMAGSRGTLQDVLNSHLRVGQVDR